MLFKSVMTAVSFVIKFVRRHVDCNKFSTLQRRHKDNRRDYCQFRWNMFSHMVCRYEFNSKSFGEPKRRISRNGLHCKTLQWHRFETNVFQVPDNFHVKILILLNSFRFVFFWVFGGAGKVSNISRYIMIMYFLILCYALPLMYKLYNMTL